MKGRLLLLATLAAPFAHADIVSTFDTDAEGWQAANIDLSTYLPNGEGRKDVTYDAAARDIGASEALFSQSGAFMLLAPEKFRGDLHAYEGGTVSFRLSDETSSAGFDLPDLLISAFDPVSKRSLAIGHFATILPSPAGTDYSVTLSPSGWRTSTLGDVSQEQFDFALRHVAGLGINADWTDDGTDVVTLDDVRVAPVPEPATLAALAGGAWLLGRRRRRAA